LLRGKYAYRVTCTASGSTASSTPAAQVSPNIEVCGTTYQGNAYDVDSQSGSTMKLERIVTNTKSNAGFSNTWGIASDPAAGEVWVTSHDSNTLKVFSRLANDPTALTGSRALNVDPEGTGTVNQPIGVALLGSEVIVAMRTSPYYLAGYPRNFVGGSAGPATTPPNWWLKGAGAGLSGPYSVTTDGNNLIFVGNTGSHSVTVFQRNQITASNHTALPPNTVSMGFGIPQGLAVDPVARELFVLDSSAARVDVVNCDGTSSTPTILRSIQDVGAAFAKPVAIRYDSGLLYILNSSTGVVNVFDHRADIASTTYPAVPLQKLGTGDLANGYGLAICN
jgi:DNA-binding beta-propeller fold protein YncE